MASNTYRKLTFRSTIDTTGFDAGISTLTSKTDTLTRDIGDQLGDLSPAFDRAAKSLGGIGDGLDFSKGSRASDDMAGQADMIRGAFLPLGAQLRQSIGGASAPIGQMLARFVAGFEEVGPVVEKLAIRIDSAMRFPAFLKRVETFRKGFLGRWGEVMKTAGDEAQASLAREADATKLVGSFTAAASKIKKALAPIKGDVGYALEAAGHVDAKGAFASYLKGLDEVKSAAVDKMRSMADAVANATGKGSRKGRWKARDQAADLASVHAASPPRQNNTAATTVPNASLWDALGKAAKVAWAVDKAGHDGLQKMSARDAKDIDRVIGAWLGFKKVASTISTFGSVAGATFAKLAGVKLPKFSIDSRQSIVLKGIGGAAQAATSHLKAFAVAGAAAAGFFSVAYTAVDFLKSGIKGASDLNETVSKTRNVLGTGSTAVEQYADMMADKFGHVKGVTLDVAAGFGGLAKGMGNLKGDKLGEFSKTFASLAADISSSKNIDLKSAGDALRIGLSGEQSDQLKQMGVTFNEDTVKAKAYASGIAQVGEALSEQQKFAARALVIQDKLKKVGVTGDLEKTADSTANQYRNLTGTIENLATTVGTAFMPAIDAYLGYVNQLVGTASAAFEANKGMIMGVVDVIVDGVDFASSVVGNFPAAVEVARLKVYEALTNVGEYFAVLGPNVVLVAKYIGDNWLLLIGDAFDATLTGLKNLWANFEKFGASLWDALSGKGFQMDWTPLLEGVQTASGKFPELIRPALTDMSKEIADAARPITDDLSAKRAKRAADKLKGAPALVDSDSAADPTAPGKEKKAAKGKEMKLFAGAEEVGTKEAYSSIVKALAGGDPKDKVQDKQLAVQKKSAELLGQVVKNGAKQAPVLLKF